MFKLYRVLIVLFVICILFEIIQTFPDGSKRTTMDDELAGQGHKPRLHRPMASPSRKRAPPGGPIFFPDDRGNPAEIRMMSRISPIPASICANSTFCENVPNYPQEWIMNALKARRNEFKHLAVVDPPFDVGQRVGVSEYESLCDTDLGIVYPKAAKTIEDEWFFIVNTEYKESNEVNFHQGFRVEKCIYPNSTCKIVNHAAAASGYDTECKQQYISRKVLGVKNGDLAEDTIMLPVSCCCHLKNRGDVFSRMANTDDTETAKKA